MNQPVGPGGAAAEDRDATIAGRAAATQAAAVGRAGFLGPGSRIKGGDAKFYPGGTNHHQQLAAEAVKLSRCFDQCCHGVFSARHGGGTGPVARL